MKSVKMANLPEVPKNAYFEAEIELDGTPGDRTVLTIHSTDEAAYLEFLCPLGHRVLEIPIQQFRRPAAQDETGKYDSPECNKFVADMKRAKQTPEHYHGRNFWEGPSVSCDADALQDVLRMTKVKCQWDNLGKGYIVYPQVSGRLLEG